MSDKSSSVRARPPDADDVTTTEDLHTSSESPVGDSQLWDNILPRCEPVVRAPERGSGTEVAYWPSTHSSRRS